MVGTGDGCVSLGTYTFDKGGSESVTIRTTGTTSYVIADAVKFVPDESDMVIDNDDTTFSGGQWTTDADDQVTTYTFADSYDASLPTKVQYPDGDATNDNVQFTYNLDGTVATRTAQK